MKVNQIRPDALMCDQKAAMQQDIDMLAGWSNSFVDVPCPACGESGRADIYEKYGMKHRICSSCETQYISPRPTPEMLGKFYAISANYAYWAKHIYPASADMRREHIFKPRAELVEKVCRDQGVVGSGTFVEVGAGYGIFCEELKARGLFDNIVGIEPSPNLATICRDRGIEIIEKPYEEIAFEGNVDVISSFEVIEHLYSPDTFARWLFDSLKPGGVVILTCPNIRGFDMMLLGKESTVVDHQHLNYFHPDSITLLLKRAGFDDIQVSTPGRLDVDLVKRAVRDEVISAASLGPFLAEVMTRCDDGTADNLQAFLQQSRLSSNMMAVATRP